MAHRAVEIGIIACLQHRRGIKFAVQLDPPVQDIDKLLATVTGQRTERGHRAGLQMYKARHHGFHLQVRAQIVVHVIAGLDPLGLALAPDRLPAARSSTHGRRRVLAAEHVAHRHRQPPRQFQDHVVGGRDRAVLDLGYGRGRHVRQVRQLVQRQVPRLATRLQAPAETPAVRRRILHLHRAASRFSYGFRHPVPSAQFPNGFSTLGQ